MGQQQSYLTKDQIKKYEANSFFTKPEIIKVYKLFMLLTSSKSGTNVLKKKLTKEEFQNITYLVKNPFRHRIANVFADTKGQIGFDEFLDFFSVFSEEATRDVKCFYAFKIYDFDEDGYVSEEDVKKVIKCLVQGELTAAEIQTAAKKVLEEADLDGEGKLSFVEFDHVIARATDFEKYTNCSSKILLTL